MERGIAAVKQSAVTNGPYTAIQEPSITAPKGFTAGGVHCGIRRKRLDLGMIASSVPATAAAVYTTNVFQAAPVKVTQASLAVEGKLQAVVVNSGIANACTGAQGEEDAREIQRQAAAMIGVPAHYVGVASTGVIGELLPVGKISAGLQQLTANLRQDGSDSFCQAILTTDTVVKKAQATVTVDGVPVVVAGAAKGSGMIQPNMATMLSFVTTDAAVEGESLQQLLRQTTDETYNMVVVDGDTSTNDTVVVMANGLAKNEVLNERHPDWPAFAAAFHYVNEQLAKAIARDGEGSTKLIEVVVSGAKTKKMAKAVAKAVIGSNLVKTAVFGADGNWGRVMCAVGYSAEPVEPDNVDVFIGGIQAVKGSLPAEYEEAAMREALAGDSVVIHIDLHQGEERAVAWGCDLTYDYVRINASYRT